jgi:hypothetical protein
MFYNNLHIKSFGLDDTMDLEGEKGHAQFVTSTSEN